MSAKKGRQDSILHPGRNRHHLYPRGRGGDNTKQNLLLLKVKRHFYWHRLFGDKSLEEVIQLLMRVHRAKGRCFNEKINRPCRLVTCFSFTNNNGNNTGKLVGGQSRIENMARINKLTEEFNGHVKKYRAMVEKVPLGKSKTSRRVTSLRKWLSPSTR